MPTFPRRPFNETKPETYPAVPTTADQRGQHVAGNDALDAAYDDIEALETGTEDAGTAAAAVAAHDSSGAAHGGVEAAFAAHDGSGGTAHLDATAVASGFLSAADKVKIDGLDPAHSGTLREVHEGGVQVTDGDKILDFYATGDASVQVTSPVPGTTRITIDATAGSGGGGIGKGSPFAVGDLMEVSSSVGDGEAVSSGLTAATVNAHISSTANPHAVQHAQTSPIADEHVAHSGVTITAGAGLTGGGDITTTRTLDVGAGEGISVNANDIAVEWAGAGGDFGTLTSVARSDHAHDAVYEPVGALRNVIEDTTPQLGGDLETKGNNIVLTRADDSIQGVLTETVSQPGAVFSYWDGVAPSVPSELHAVSVEPHQIGLWGTSVFVDGLQHAELGGRQVYVSEDGILYGVNPPPVGWTAAAADTGNYNLGTGDGQTQAWVEISGLGAPGLTFAQDVEVGQRIDVSVNLYIVHGKDGDVNDPFDKSGSMDIAFGIGGATPGPNDAAASASIGPYFSGWVPVSFSTTADQAYTAGTELQVFARNGGGEDGSSTIFAQYSAPGPGTGPGHEAVISTPGSSSSGGGEANLGANVGVVGEGVFKDKTGVTLNFKKLNSVNGTIDVSANGVDNVGLDVSTLVARRDEINTFVTGQIINDPLGQPGFYFADNGTRVFGLFSVTGPDFLIAPVNAGGSATAIGVGISNVGTVTIGTATGGGFPPGEGELNVERSVTAKVGVFLENAGTPREYLNPVKAETIGSDVGYAFTTKAVSGTFTPNPLTGQALTLAAAGTASAMAVDGICKVYCNSGVTVDVSAYTETNAAPTGRAYAVVLEKAGAILLATYQ